MWRRVSQCFDRHEREMIKVAKRERRLGPCQAHAYEVDEDEKRMDIIGQNGNTGEHYEELNRGNWWGLADDWEDEPVKETPVYKGANYTGRNKEPDATSMDDDPPSAAEDNARSRGNYEL